MLSYTHYTKYVNINTIYLIIRINILIININLFINRVKRIKLFNRLVHKLKFLN